jgi:hypothetical protein
VTALTFVGGVMIFCGLLIPCAAWAQDRKDRKDRTRRHEEIIDGNGAGWRRVGIGLYERDVIVEQVARTPDVPLHRIVGREPAYPRSQVRGLHKSIDWPIR